MEISELERLKELEEENRRLKQMYAESRLENTVLKEIIEKNKCGLCVDPLNPKEIAEAIEHLLNDPHKAEEMGKNGIKAVSSTFNWKNESNKLQNLYYKLLENK